MAKALVMDKKPVRKVERGKTRKRKGHYEKNALNMHVKTCSDPEWCNADQEIPDELRDDTKLPWPSRQELARKRLEWMHYCQSAVDAENASAEIERHLAAIRKIKRRGKPLKGKEFYGVYPT